MCFLYDLRPASSAAYFISSKSCPFDSFTFFFFLPHIIFIFPLDLQPEDDAAQDTLAPHAYPWPSGRETDPETFYVALDRYLLTASALFDASEMSVASAYIHIYVYIYISIDSRGLLILDTKHGRPRIADRT